MKIRSKILAVLAVPAVFLGASTVALIDAGAQTTTSLEEERKAFGVEKAFQRVEQGVIDAESAMKGYLITGGRGPIRTYLETVAHLPSDMSALADLTASDPSSAVASRTLQGLVSHRVSLLDSLRPLAPINDATDHVRLSRLTGAGASVMFRLQGFLDRQEAEARLQLDTQQRSLNAARRRWFLVGVAGMPLGMLVSLLAVAFYTQRFGNRIAKTQRVARLLDEGMPLGAPSTSKDELGTLERALIRTGTRLVELQGELRRMGTSDPLTRLLNRRGFIPSAEHQLEVAKRTDQPMALLFLDLDGLKRVNDSQGHAAGDGMITEATHVMNQTFRASDLIGRMGGDEFCVLFAASSTDEAEVALVRLQEAVEKTNDQQGRPFTLSLSAGLAMFDPQRPSTLDEIMAVADARMYEAKRAKVGARA